MKIGVVGSRSITVRCIGDYLVDCDEIVSGGARGVDSCAGEYARKHGIKLVEFLPDYHRYGGAAPIIRNRRIVEYADRVIAFWDGKSKGAKMVIEYAEKVGKECRIVMM